jgi:hypothetical protein
VVPCCGGVWCRLLPTDFSEKAGDLTPTLKLKRSVVADKYKDLIDSVRHPFNTQDSGSLDTNKATSGHIYGSTQIATFSSPILRSMTR